MACFELPVSDAAKNDRKPRDFSGEKVAKAWRQKPVATVFFMGMLARVWVDRSGCEVSG
jgi:hypothetical protein